MEYTTSKKLDSDFSQNTRAQINTFSEDSVTVPSNRYIKLKLEMDNNVHHHSLFLSQRSVNFILYSSRIKTRQLLMIEACYERGTFCSSVMTFMRIRQIYNVWSLTWYCYNEGKSRELVLQSSSSLEEKVSGTFPLNCECLGNWKHCVSFE